MDTCNPSVPSLAAIIRHFNVSRGNLLTTALFIKSKQLTAIQARDAVDPLSALRFWSDEQEGHREVENYVSIPPQSFPICFLSIYTDIQKINRFARRSRALHRHDMLTDDASSLATLSAASSSASTISGSTVTPPSPPSFRTGTQTPSSNPPSYRSTASSIRSTSILSNYLANQRRPPQAPPLINSQGNGAANSISRVGADGRNRLARGSVVSLPASGADEGSQASSEAGSGSGSASGGRRLGRRASFFAMLRNVRN